MGTDISGFIEVRPWPHWPDLPEEVDWEAAVRLDCLYNGRSYDAFGCLFGVMNFAGFRPVAADRGLPADASATVRAEFETAPVPNGNLFPTWTTWAEIRAIDCDEPAERADHRLHRYERQSDGEWAYRGKSGWSRESYDVMGLPVDPIGAPPREWPAGSVWTKGDVQFRAERLTRRDAIPLESDWDPVWQTMALLGRLHGDDNCRLVVWFDR